jgi:hypothetical protein
MHGRAISCKNPADFFQLIMKRVHDFGSCPSGDVRSDAEVNGSTKERIPPFGFWSFAVGTRVSKTSNPAKK